MKMIYKTVKKLVLVGYSPHAKKSNFNEKCVHVYLLHDIYNYAGGQYVDIFKRISLNKSLLQCLCRHIHSQR